MIDRDLEFSNNFYEALERISSIEFEESGLSFITDKDGRIVDIYNIRHEASQQNEK